MAMAANHKVPRPILLALIALLYPMLSCAHYLSADSISSNSRHHVQIPLLSSSPRNGARESFNRRGAFANFPSCINSGTLCNASSFNRSVLDQLRGGAITSRQSKPSPINRQQNQNPNILTITSIIILSIAVLLSILNWETLVLSLTTFFDKEKFRKLLLETLNSISAKGTKGLITYTLGFVLWETCGLPTSVVETAAGMAFGFNKGLLCSFTGKSLGSILAFSLGRTFCKSLVKEQLQDNEVLELMEKSVARHPIRSALIMRYSPFPQLVKNFSLSVTEAVKFPVFLLAIGVHGFPFSVLWAALGYDSALRLRSEEIGESLDVNWVLNGSLVFVTFFGFVVSPIITGWWLAGLRKESVKSI